MIGTLVKNIAGALLKTTLLKSVFIAYRNALVFSYTFKMCKLTLWTLQAV